MNQRYFRLRYFVILNVVLGLGAVFGLRVYGGLGYILSYYLALLLFLVQFACIIAMIFQKKYKQALKTFFLVGFFALLIFCIYYINIILLGGALGDG